MSSRNAILESILQNRSARAALACIVLACLGLAGCSSFGQPERPLHRSNPYLGRSQAAAESDDSWLGSLFNKEPEKPKSVNEFLRQPRPGV